MFSFCLLFLWLEIDFVLNSQGQNFPKICNLRSASQKYIGCAIKRTSFVIHSLWKSDLALIWRHKITSYLFSMWKLLVVSVFGSSAQCLNLRFNQFLWQSAPPRGTRWLFRVMAKFGECNNTPRTISTLLAAKFASHDLSKKYQLQAGWI